MKMNNVHRISENNLQWSSSVKWWGFFALSMSMLGWIPTSALAQSNSAGRAVFSIQASAATVELGSVIDLTIQLGTEAQPLTDVNGVGFELHQQGNAFSLEQIIWHDFPAGESNSIRFAEAFPGTGNYGISVSRNDGGGADGFGALVTIRLRLEQALFDGYEFSLRNALVINAFGVPFTSILPLNFTVSEEVVAPRVPGIVQLVSPPDAASDLGISPEFIWLARADADSYDFEIALDPNFTFGRQRLSSTSDRLTLPNPLDYESTYFWRVRGVNEAGAGEWSRTRVFGTITLPLPPSRVVLFTPPNQQSNVSVNPVFEWFPAAGANRYEFMLSQDPGFATGVTLINTEGLSASLEQTLDFETVYFWRVRALNEVGAGPWSAIRVFSTVENPQPGLVSLLSPANGSIGVSISPEFTWMPAQRTTGYQLQVSATADFTTNILSAQTTDTRASLTENLAFDRVYFWRVRATNDSGIGSWSETRIFATVEEPLPPTRVNLELPVNRDFQAGINPLFSWLPAFGAESYTFQLALDPGFESVVNEVNLPQLQHVLSSPLNYETTYYWRVRASNAVGDGAWSATRLFITIPDPTPKPPQRVFLIAPVNQAQGVARVPQFSWLASESATSYDIQIATDPAFSRNLQSLNTSDSFLQLTDPLAYEMVYYWRVRGVNEAGVGAWSLTRIFVTEVDPMPGRVLLLLPSNGQFDVSVTPTLGWTSARSAQSYTYEVARDPIFADIVATGSQSETNVTLSNSLSHETTHFWRVRATNDLGAGSWSETRIFTTLPAPVLPGRIALNSPSNQATGVSATPSFSWAADPDANEYEILVARDPGFTTGVVTQILTNNQWTPSEALSSNTLYFWMVRGRNDIGNGPWSFIYIFTTESENNADAGNIAGAPVQNFDGGERNAITADATTPTLVSPATGDTGVNELPLLTWSVVSGATSYEYAFSTDVSFEAGVTSGSVAETQFQLVQALAFETSYFWRVRATVDGTPGSWSTIGLFTTRANPTPDPVAPARVSLDTPANQATDVSVSTALSWLAANHADTYRVELYSDAQLSNRIAESETANTTFTPASPLAFSSSYYWRVRGINAVGNGEWSSLRLFTTQADPNQVPEPPVAVTLTSPFTGTEGVAKSGATLEWSAIEQVTGYTVQISTVADFSTTLLNVSTEQTSYTITEASIEFNTLYYWRVRATNTAGDGEWSATWLFTTEPDPVPPAVVLSGPGNAVEAVAIQPTLTWQSSDRATSYEIQLSLTTAFGEGTIARTTTDLSLQLDENLGYSTVHYWRVRAMNGTTPGAWSAVWIFTTEADPTPAPVLPDRAVLSAPQNQATGVSSTPTLSWNAANAALSYTVGISLSPSFENHVLLETAVTGTQLEVSSALQFETTYYWRVRSVNDTGNADWSLIFVFTTQSDPTPPPSALLAVDLLLPQIGAVDVDVNPTMVWRSTATATSYQLQLATDAAFTTGVVSQQQSDTTTTLSALEFETTYYWRVRSIRDTEEGPWSTTRIFTTQANPVQDVPLPNRVTLSTPANLAVQVPTSPTLVWRTANNATSYELQFGTDPTFAVTLLAATTSDTTRVTGLTLAFETVHFWRVRAVNATGNGEWSTVFSFTTIPDPTPPPVPPSRISQLLPADTVVDQDVRPLFTWQADASADKYTIQISESPLFTTILFGIEETGTSAQMQESLGYSTTYYWRVRASNEAGVGPWSTIRSFTTKSFFSAFSLLSPANGASLMIEGDEAKEVAITWEAAQPETTTAVTYTFYMLETAEASLGDALHQTAADGDGSETQITFTIAALAQMFGLESGQSADVFWTVVASGNAHSREASARFALRLTQGVVTDVPSSGTLPTDFVLSQNFPNPFNPGTRIAYAVPGEQHVYVGVYDLLGRRVAVLVNQVQPAGSYTVDWNAQGLSSGIYLYRLDAGGFSQTRRMMLMK